METAKMSPSTDEWIKKCDIYTQWNFIQLQRGMKFCHSEVNGWNWRKQS
jgi:GH43 family beta-xylosidase